MTSESAPDRTIGERAVEFLDRLHDTYDSVAQDIRDYTPYLVRAMEVALAVALLALLGHWLYWVYIAGAG